MRWMLALFLLSSPFLVGCDQLIRVPGKAAQASEEAPELPTDISPELEESDSADLQPVPEVDPLPLAAAGVPDPLAEEPAEIQGLKGAAAQADVWLFFYGGQWGALNRTEETKLRGWANGKSLTVSAANIDNARYARVLIVDVTRDPVKRDLRYGNAQPLYPTYVIVDRNGGELWHHVGAVDTAYLDWVWDLANKQRSKKSAPFKSAQFSLPPEPVSEVQKPPAETWTPTSDGEWECNGKRCRPRKRG